MAQALRGGRRVAQEAEVFVFAAEVLFEGAPVQQAHVGVLPFPEPAQDRRQEDTVDLRGACHTVGQGAHMAQCGLRVGESNRLVAFERGLFAQRHRFVW